jgi:hypothetical protein
MIILFAILDVILAVIAVELYLKFSKDDTPHIIMRTEKVEPLKQAYTNVKTVRLSDEETREELYSKLMSYIDDAKYPLYEQHTDDESQMAVNVYDLRNFIKQITL